MRKIGTCRTRRGHGFPRARLTHFLTQNERVDWVDKVSFFQTFDRHNSTKMTHYHAFSESETAHNPEVQALLPQTKTADFARDRLLFVARFPLACLRGKKAERTRIELILLALQSQTQTAVGRNPYETNGEKTLSWLLTLSMPIGLFPAVVIPACADVEDDGTEPAAMETPGDPDAPPDGFEQSGGAAIGDGKEVSEKTEVLSDTNEPEEPGDGRVAWRGTDSLLCENHRAHHGCFVRIRADAARGARAGCGTVTGAFCC